MSRLSKIHLPATQATDTSSNAFSSARNALALRIVAVPTGPLPADAGALPSTGFDAAAIVIDAQTGVTSETRQQTYICNALGVRDLLLIINKMDIVDFNETVFGSRVAEIATYIKTLGLSPVAAIPISAIADHNIATPSSAMPWYKGDPLTTRLAQLAVSERAAPLPLRFAIGSVAGTTVSGMALVGEARRGDSVVALRAERVTRITGITSDQSSEQRLTLADELGAAAGDILVSSNNRPSLSDHVAAHVLWLDSEKLLPQRAYTLKMGSSETTARITAIKYKADPETMGHLATRCLDENDLGFCNIATTSLIAYDEQARGLGAFLLCDRADNRPVGMGRIAFGLRRATNVHIENLFVDKAGRAGAKHQRPTVVWFTGLSGSGKSTIAKHLEKALHARGHHTYVLDGDNVRHGLNRDLGFTDADRIENIRRIGEVAKLFVDAGLIVLCSFISPFRAERQGVRETLDDGEYIEVFVDAPLDVCRQRDPKKLYAKADAGQIKNFTGIDSVYEAPLTPELHLQTDGADVETLVAQIISFLKERQRI